MIKINLVSETPSAAPTRRKRKRASALETAFKASYGDFLRVFFAVTEGAGAHIELIIGLTLTIALTLIELIHGLSRRAPRPFRGIPQSLLSRPPAPRHLCSQRPLLGALR